MITSISQLDLSQRYSYADYLAWKFTERVELLKGYLRQMSAPGVKHQRVSMRLSGVLFNFFAGSPCEVFHAPFDVRLYNRKKSVLQDKEVFTVVQPDICVVCEPEKLADGKGCNGAPEWIIEIVSPGSVWADTKEKFQLYEEAGVAEYWVVHPNEFIQQYVLREGRYVYEQALTYEDTAIPTLFPALSIPVKDLFEGPVV